MSESQQSTPTSSSTRKSGRVPKKAVRRKGWTQLSEPTRRRYRRAGITSRSYAAGADLRAARGHSVTPEHPREAEQQPAKFRGYLKRRAPKIKVLVTSGVMWVEGLSKDERSTVAKHWNAVEAFLADGDDHGLDGFEGDTLDGHELETRRHVLEDYALRGQLSFESIYRNL